jgi:hypothetical protein
VARVAGPRLIFASSTIAHPSLHPGCGKSLWFLSKSVRQAARLLQLQEPYQEIDVGQTVSGGTVGIWIRDTKGKVDCFAIPTDSAALHRLGGSTTVLIGTITFDDDPHRYQRAAHPVATEQALVLILDLHRKGNPWIDASLAILTHRAADQIRVFIHEFRDDYEP